MKFNDEPHSDSESVFLDPIEEGEEDSTPEED